MQKHTCILIADDDPEIRAMVRVVLDKAGYQTRQVENGLQAVQACRENPPDLVVMDYMMPVLDGFEACRQIREFSDVPIVLLTVHSGEEDVVGGLSAGAYDFIIKPFRPKELVARVESLLARAPARQAARRRLAYADLELNPRTREVIRAGARVEVTAMGYQLLEYFMSHCGEVISKEDLLRDVWGYKDAVGGKNMVEAAIKRLRKEIRDDSRQPKYLRTVWGVGYRFGEPKS